MKKLFLGVSLVVILSQLTACGITREQGGALLGGAVGGVVGNQVGGGHGQDIATAVGIFAGAFAGASVGRSLDQLDAINTQQAFESNKTNQTSSWTNPDSGNLYSVTPTKTYQTASKQYCREYQTTLTVGGQREQAYGTACRQLDGDWEVL